MPRPRGAVTPGDLQAAILALREERAECDRQLGALGLQIAATVQEARDLLGLLRRADQQLTSNVPGYRTSPLAADIQAALAVGSQRHGP